MFNAFLKHPDLLDNPVQEGESPWARLQHRYDLDQADFADLIERFRAILDEADGRMSVGELFYGGTDAAARYTRGRHIVFDWSLMEAPWTAADFAAGVDLRETAYGGDRWPTIALSNHDRERQATRLAASTGRDRDPDHDAIAKAAAVLILTMRGTPFLYYGEEIGMLDVDIPRDEIVDPPALRAGPDFPWYDRSRCRTPMQWEPGPGAGFTTGRPWLRLGPDADHRNVAAQAGDPDSVLAAYRRLLEFRRTAPALRTGSMQRRESGTPDVLAWTREADDQRLLVLVSFVGDDRTVALHDVVPGVRWTARVGSDREPASPGPDGRITLRSDEAVVLEAVAG